MIIVACSNQVSDRTNSDAFPGVDLNLEPNMSRAMPIVDIAKEENTGYGPSIEIPQSYIEEKKSIHMPVIGVILGPGLYRVIAHIQILKAFKKNDINVNVIAGIGISSIVAALYATGDTPDKIEWIFHKFFNQIKDYPPYSSSWILKAKQELIDLHPWKTIEELDLLTTLPSYSELDNQYNYTNRGNLKQVLEENLIFLSTDGKELGKFNIYDVSVFHKLGVDILIGIDILNNKIKFDTMSDISIHKFNQISNLSFSQKGQLSLYLDPPIDDMSLDSLDNLPEYTLKTFEYGNIISLKIKTAISGWQERTNVDLE